MKVGSRLFCGAGLATLLFLCGCGFLRAPVTPEPLAPAEALGGNWLIYGEMPTLDGGLSNAGRGLAMSFDVQNGKITGTAHLADTCASGAPVNFLISENSVSSTAAQDGSFTTSFPGSLGSTFVISGTAPNANGKPWSGTYNLSQSGTANACAYSLSGSFTATPVADVSGTFAGIGTLAAYFGSGVTPANATIALSASLVQRGSPPGVTNPAAYSDEYLGGSLQISGIPCFSKGAPSAKYSGEIVGNATFPFFDMEDGSQLSWFGTIDNTAATRLLINSILVSGDQCAGTYTFTTPLILSR